MRTPKLRHAEIEQIGSLKQALSLISDTAAAAIDMAQAVQTSADRQIEEHRQVMQKHLDRKDLRPRVNFKPLGENTWAVTFGAETYYIGLRAGWDYLDEDEPRFEWKAPNGKVYAAVSMFQALIGVVQDYCNAGEQRDQDKQAS